jgi:hypothetical protein
MQPAAVVILLDEILGVSTQIFQVQHFSRGNFFLLDDSLVIEAWFEANIMNIRVQCWLLIFLLLLIWF